MPLIRILGRGIRIPDLDRLFCYDTPKLLRVIDFKPGVVYRAGIVFVILYCFGFALVTMQMYLVQTDAVGIAMVNVAESVEGKVIKSKIGTYTDEDAQSSAMHAGAGWDSHDLIYPPTEVGGIFITTRATKTVGQMMKECADSDTTFPTCKKQMPIYPGLKYPGTKHCMEYTWCPKFGQGGQASTDEVLDAEDLGEVELEFNLFLNWFPNDDPDIFVKHNKKVTVKDIASSAGIADITEVLKTGCILYVKFSFGTATQMCSTSDEECEPEMQVVRLDEAEPGFRYRRANYYRGNGTAALPKEIRDVSRNYGIRIVTTATGRGETFSLSACLLQIASALAMWQLVYFVADIFTVFLNLRAFKYYGFKYAATPDFGDLKEQEENKKIDAQAGKKSKRPRTNRARKKALGGDEEDEEG